MAAVSPPAYITVPAPTLGFTAGLGHMDIRGTAAAAGFIPIGADPDAPAFDEQTTGFHLMIAGASCFFKPSIRFKS
jgi:hypothetical protein